MHLNSNACSVRPLLFSISESTMKFLAAIAIVLLALASFNDAGKVKYHDLYARLVRMYVFILFGVGVSCRILYFIVS